MGDCPICTKKRSKLERAYRSEPRYRRYRSQPSERDTQIYHPRQQRTNVNGHGLWNSQRRYAYQCPPPCCCRSPCPETQCCCCPEGSESGFFNTIRSGFQKIFSKNRKGFSEKFCTPKTYNDSTSQLRYTKQQLDKLENEICCVENTIKEAFEYNYQINCDNLKCSLDNFMGQLEEIRCELMCALECYDPYRDKREYDLICDQLKRTDSLGCFIDDLCLQLECLEYQPTNYSGPCKTNCRKPCCVKQPPCKPNCKKPCCYPSVRFKLPNNCQRYMHTDANQHRELPRNTGCQKLCCVKPFDLSKKYKNAIPHSVKSNLRQTSSVIPLGVMLVKL